MGGVIGHISHLYDNRYLTFGEIKDIIASAAEGKLEHVTEKLDGINIVFTWDRGLKVARSGGDIKSGGMGASELAAKFSDRQNLAAAFNNAFTVLQGALSSLSEQERVSAFGDRGTTWYSAEIIYTANPNVINYDHNNVVFHGWPVYKATDSGIEAQGAGDQSVNKLASYINKMQASVANLNWRIMGPALVQLDRLSNSSASDNAIAAIESIQSDAGVGDGATIEEYLWNLMDEEANVLQLSPRIKQMVVSRSISEPDCPGLPQIKKAAPPFAYPRINEFVKQAPAMLKSFIEPLEVVVSRFAAELLKSMRSVLISNQDKEVARLRSRLELATKAIESSGNQAAIDTLQRQLRKLGGAENITTAAEGIVFIYKGNAYKFTGSFAPLNQILGMFRYGRGAAIPAMELREQFKADHDDVMNKLNRRSLL